MIKFFRNIRQKLLTENKFSKYLIYAVGEIVLVVIGILIALQINNWNESRKIHHKELQLYVTILDDLHDEYGRINSKYASMKHYQNLHYEVYNQTMRITPFDSTLNYNSLEWIFPYHMNFSEKYAESTVSIFNDRIRDLLKSYISSDKSTSDAYTEWNKLKENRLRAFFNKHGIHNTEAVFGSQPYNFSLASVNLIDYSKLKEQYGTTELDELLYDLRFKSSWIFQQLNWLKEANRELEEALINEIKLAKMYDKIIRISPIKLSKLLNTGKKIDEIVDILKHEDRKKPTYDISEREINSLGYNLMRQNKNEDALKVFKLNTELYPKEYNTYDSYGECLLKMGDKENAMKAYQKSFELFPNNTDAKKILSELK